MADRIKGLTLKINGDTTQLSTELKKVNGQLYDTQAALKDVDRLLKMDPKNADLLRQKQELLSKAIDDSAEKLKKLRTAQDQMKAEGVDQNSRAYQNLEREIIATEQSMQKLNTSAEQLNSELSKTQTTADKMAASSSKIAQGAQAVADKTKALSAAAGGAVAALGGMAIKAAKDADELNTLSKQSGLSTEALQKMKYAADLVDVDVSTITSSVRKMKKSLDSNADAFEKIGVATKDANGAYRDTEAIFYDVVEALGSIENETERDIVAMDIFGKSADELAGIIDDGGKAMKALGDEAKNKGLIISQEDLDKANALNDTLDRLKATVAGSLGQAAASAAEALAPVLETLAGVVAEIAGYISKLSPDTIRIIAIIAGAIAVISPVASLIATIASTISTVIPLITSLNAVIAANPIVLTIAGIVAAITALTIAGVALYKHWDEIKAKAKELWEGLKEKFTAIKDAAVEKFEAMKEKCSNAFENIKTAAKEKFEAAKNAMQTAATAAKDTVQEKLNNIKDAFERNGGGIKGATMAAWEGIKGYYTAGFSFVNKLTGGKLGEIVSMFREKFTEIITSAKNWGKDLIDSFVQGIKDKIGAVKDAVVNVAQTIADFLHFSVPDKGPLSDAMTYMPDFMKLLSEGINENLYRLNQPLDALSSKISNSAQVDVNYNDSALTGRLDTINNSILQGTQSIVKVELAPNISNLFRVLQAEGYRQAKALGGI